MSVDAFGDTDQKARVTNLSLVRDLERPWSVTGAVAAAGRYPGRAVVYGSNFENHPAAVARLARGRERLGNAPAALRAARDVARLQSVVVAAGGRVPVTRGPGEARDAGHHWLRKPRQGGGGTGIRPLAAGETLGSREIAQERIDGIAGSVSFVADGQRAVVLGVARGLAGDAALGASGFRYCGSLYPFRLDAALAERLDAIVQAATAAFELVGVNGLDFVVCSGEAFVLELNPRYCASMELVERATGTSLFDVHVKACRGTLPPAPETPPAGTWGKAVLWATADAVAPDTRSWLARDDVRDVPAPGDALRRGLPICTVFATGADDARCYTQLLSTARALGLEQPVAALA